MAWKTPETLGTLPPAAWLLEMAVFVVAMTPQDWVTIIVGVMAATGGSWALLGRWAWAKWEESNAKQLGEERRGHARTKLSLQNAVDDLAAERADRAERKKERQEEVEAKDAELARLQAVVNSVRAELVEAYKTVAAKDAVILSRDHAVDDNSRRISRMGEDIARMAAIILKLQGNSRGSRES